MKRSNHLLVTLCALCCTSFFLTSCQKSGSNPSDNLTVTAQQQSELTASAEADEEASSVYNEEFDNAVGVNADLGVGTNIGVFEGKLVNGREDSSHHCFNLTISPLTPGVFPKTVTLDFGSGCTGPRGVTRRGKVITVYTGPLAIAGNSSITTFQDYYVDSVKVEGSLKVENKSTSSGLAFTTTVENGKLTKPSGNYILWNQTRNWTQVEGQSTPFKPSDDVYNITGSASGTIKKDSITTQYTASITDALVRKFSCRWISKGLVEITKNELKATLDYGNGHCDNEATLTIGGVTINIKLR